MNNRWELLRSRKLGAPSAAISWWQSIRIGILRSVLLFLLILSAFVAPEVLDAGATSSPTAPAALAFEIRDFRITETILKIPDIGSRTVTYVGTGTVIVQDATRRDRNYLLAVTERVTPSGRKPTESLRFITLTRGKGTISTDYLKERLGGSGIPQYEWILIGYIELQPGTLSIVK